MGKGTDDKHTELHEANTKNGSSSKSSGSGSAGAGGRGRGRGTGGKTSGEEKRVLEPVLVAIDIPGEDKEEKPKPKRGRPKGSSTKKKAAVGKPNAPAPMDSTQIQVLLLTVSGIVASRPGMAVWNLTAEEAEQIAKPLSNMMAKNEAISKVAGEHADALALVTACFMIFVPKFIMYQASKPKKPKEGNKLTYETTNRPARPAQPTDTGGTAAVHHGANHERSTNDHPSAGNHFGGQLSELIPSTAGI